MELGFLSIVALFAVAYSAGLALAFGLCKVERCHAVLNSQKAGVAILLTFTLSPYLMVFLGSFLGIIGVMAVALLCGFSYGLIVWLSRA